MLRARSGPCACIDRLQSKYGHPTASQTAEELVLAQTYVFDGVLYCWTTAALPKTIAFRSRHVGCLVDRVTAGGSKNRLRNQCRRQPSSDRTAQRFFQKVLLMPPQKHA